MGVVIDSFILDIPGYKGLMADGDTIISVGWLTDKSEKNRRPKPLYLMQMGDRNKLEEARNRMNRNRKFWYNLKWFNMENIV